MNKNQTKALLKLALDQNYVLAQRIFDLEQQLFRAPKPVTADALAALITGRQDKIKSIKAVRAITGMGLKEAKDFVEDMGVWT